MDLDTIRARGFTIEVGSEDGVGIATTTAMIFTLRQHAPTEITTIVPDLIYRINLGRTEIHQAAARLIPLLRILEPATAINTTEDILALSNTFQPAIIATDPRSMAPEVERTDKLT